jgi:hypothetical protein
MMVLYGFFVSTWFLSFAFVRYLYNIAHKKQPIRHNETRLTRQAQQIESAQKGSVLTVL